MTARSSSLACSRLPAAPGRGGGHSEVARPPGPRGGTRRRTSTGSIRAKECDSDTFRFDLEGRAHQGEQGGVEHDGAVAVEGHVHGDQPLQEGRERQQAVHMVAVLLLLHLLLLLQGSAAAIEHQLVVEPL